MSQIPRNIAPVYKKPVNYIEKEPEDFFKPLLAESLPVEHINVFRVKRKTVALIVVPGIMASRLVDADNKPVWDPDNIGFMLGKVRGASPQRRYDLIIGNARSVATTNDKIKGIKDIATALARGWAGPSWTYYGNLIKSLHNWSTSLRLFIDFPVYAYGYDWVRTNRASGEGLRAFIDSLNPKPDQVIIITHSMGGLVTRYALGGPGGEACAAKVLGVIHGAQPVHGAPAAYRRQIAGTESTGGLVSGIASQVLGSTGPAITAVFPHAPGALELLPSGHYRTNNGQSAWLHIEDPENPGAYTSLPAQGDPYEEIYKVAYSEEYWGMLHEDWLLPAGSRETVLVDTKDNLNNAKSFHEEIYGYTHPRTLQLFSSGGQHTTSEICWHTSDITQIIQEKIKKIRYISMRNRAKVTETFSNLHLTRKFKRGEYSEARWHTPGSAKPGPLVARGTSVDELEQRLKRERIYEFWLTPYGETGPQGLDSGHWPQGDGTVPRSSAMGLAPAAANWGRAASCLPSAAGRECTGRANQAEHSEFYDKNAVTAVQNAIHNLCVAWLKQELD